MATENINTSISVNSIDFKHSRARHIVPFRFNDSDYEEVLSGLKSIESTPFQLYDYFSKQEKKDFKWVQQTVKQDRSHGEDKNTESMEESNVQSDLSPNIKNETLLDDDVKESNKNCIGSFWRYTNVSSGDSKTNIISFLYYFAHQISFGSEPKFNYLLSFINISEIGLYLYKNGIGFFWYEYQIDNNKKIETSMDGKEVDLMPIDNTDNFVTFQNIFKELSFSDKLCLYINVENEYRPFFLGSWIKNMLQEAIGKDFVCFQIERNIADEINKKMNEATKDEKKGAYSPIFEASTNKVKINGNLYTLVNKIPDNQKEQLNRIPDVAILFSYFVFDKRDLPDFMDKTTLNLIYRLTNGFNSSYKGYNLETSILRQNDNVVYSGNRQGCTYITWKTGMSNNDYFFKSIMYSKVMIDFFRLYIRVLYQSYTLQYLGEIIATDLSSDYREYNSLETVCVDDLSKIENIITEINTFLAKVTTTSVSFQENQNNYYNYLIEKMRIKGDVKTVQAGLDSLYKMQSETYDKKREEQEEKQSELLHTIEKLGTILAALGIPTLFMEISETITSLLNCDMISAVVKDIILSLSIFIQYCFINIVRKNLKRLKQERTSCTYEDCKKLQVDSAIYSAVKLIIMIVTLIMIIRLVVDIFSAVSSFISHCLE